MATVIKKNFKDFGSLRAQLEEKKNSQNTESNLYTHLGLIMDHIIHHCPDEALNKLEEVSYLIKHGDRYQIEEFLRVNEVR
jgi:hypothetical protein